MAAAEESRESGRGEGGREAEAEAVRTEQESKPTWRRTRILALALLQGGESPGKTRQRRESFFFVCIHVILFLLQQFGNKLII